MSEVRSLLDPHFFFCPTLEARRVTYFLNIKLFYKKYFDSGLCVQFFGLIFLLYINRH